MIGLGIIVAAVLLYKAYKLRLKHDMELESLRKENADLRAQLERLRVEYEEVIKQRENYRKEENLSDADRLERLAEAIRRKESLF